MKRIFTFGLLVAAAFALTNCAQKESYAPVQEEATFEVVANLPVDTKTYNDGMSTKWSDDDQVSVILELPIRQIIRLSTRATESL